MSKNLTLSIKQVFFDEILSGKKKNEIREIKPSNVKKYCQVDKEGFVLENENGIVAVKYNTITFLTGAYVGTRPRMVIEVKSSKILLIEDDNNEFIELTDDKGNQYLAAVIEYKLGEIIQNF